jgi:hypothetical protein
MSRAASGSVFLIALAVLVIRHGHVRFPHVEDTVRPSSGSEPGLRREGPGFDRLSDLPDRRF